MANPSSSSNGGSEALQRLKSIEPPLWLSPSPELSESARAAAKYLFSSLHPFCPKSPIESLLIDDRYDAEQIWQQIDLQTQPLISNLRRQVKRFEKNPEEISKLFGGGGGGGGELLKKKKKKKKKEAEVQDDLVKEDEKSEEDEEGSEDFEDEESDDEDAEVGEEDEEEEEEEEEEEGNGGDGGIEDRFLKIKELQKYVEDDEDREYGGGQKKKKKRRDSKVDKESDEDEEDEDEDEDDEMGILGVGSDEDEDDEMGNARYEDFFGGKKKQSSEMKSESPDGSEELDSDDEQEDEKGLFYQKKEPLSTHEKETVKRQSKIEQMEKANMEPKAWTMQGEVNAMKRPKNSALEIDLDFEHNVRPAPVITEEVTASLEELIKKRILEEHFDDVQRAPSLSSTAPKEVKEIDDNKSKKGLAEIYEEDYVKKADPASAPLSFSDEQKKEASLLFKKLCLKLDALSHFHFTPKPVIEDMSIQANVPALAMEEIAPVAVSDAAMLAPEELFAGKGDIKEEAELTQAERKRRRANKKRKFKAETTKRMEKKPRNNTLPTESIAGKET